jgi:hypothetical protein
LLLVEQLLTFFRFRDWHDQKLEALATARKDLRQARVWDAQQEKEATTVRYV